MDMRTLINIVEDNDGEHDDDSITRLKQDIKNEIERARGRMKLDSKTIQYISNNAVSRHLMSTKSGTERSLKFNHGLAQRMMKYAIEVRGDLVQPTQKGASVKDTLVGLISKQSSIPEEELNVLNTRELKTLADMTDQDSIRKSVDDMVSRKADKDSGMETDMRSMPKTDYVDKKHLERPTAVKAVQAANGDIKLAARKLGVGSQEIDKALRDISNKRIFGIIRKNGGNFHTTAQQLLIPANELMAKAQKFDWDFSPPTVQSEIKRPHIFTTKAAIERHGGNLQAAADEIGQSVEQVKNLVKQRGWSF